MKEKGERKKKKGEKKGRKETFSQFIGQLCYLLFFLILQLEDLREKEGEGK